MPGTSKYGIGITSQSANHELTLPSGNVCLVRTPDPTAFIGLGILDKVDRLTNLVGMKIGEIDASGKPPVAPSADAIKDLAGQTDNLMAGLELIDIVLEWCVVEPRVVRPVKRNASGRPIKDANGEAIPLEPHERLADVTYTDQVLLDDRMFILNYAIGGSTDLEAFRAGTAGVVDALASSEDVRLSAIGNAGRQ